tara:strand:+ start:2405 stop:5353 length:2949 start_codon:yes stop_codon:yes gene_type:complete
MKKTNPQFNIPAALLPVLNLLFVKNSNPWKNIAYMSQEEEDHEILINEWKNMLGHVGQLRTSSNKKLRQAPEIAYVEKDESEDNDYDRTSQATSRPLKNWVDIDFNAFPGRRAKRNSDPLTVSQHFYLYYRGMWDSLNFDHETFKALFEKRPIQDQGERRPSQNVADLLKNTVYGLPKGLQPQFLDSIADGTIKSSVQLIKYMKEILGEDADGIVYKFHRGDYLHTLSSMFETKDLVNPRVEVAVDRILSDTIVETPLDWRDMTKCAMQVVKEDMEAYWGKWKKDIEYASVEDLALSVSPDKVLGLSFSPIHYDRSMKLPYTSKAIGEKLEEDRITRSEADGILEALPKFKSRRNAHLREWELNYFPDNDIEQTLDSLWKVWKADNDHIADAKSQEQKANPILTKKDFVFLRDMFNKIDYQYHEHDNNPRKGSVRIALRNAYSIQDDIETLEHLFVVGSQWEIAHDKSETEKRAVMSRSYTVVTEKEYEKHQKSLEKLKGTYLRAVKDNSEQEKQALKDAGYTNSKSFHAFREELQVIEEALDHGVMPSYHTGKDTQLAKAVSVVKKYKKIPVALQKKIDFLNQTKELGLDTSNILADSGMHTEMVNDPRFDITPFTHATYVSDDQRTAIETVYDKVTENKALSDLARKPAQLDTVKAHLEKVKKVSAEIKNSDVFFYEQAKHTVTLRPNTLKTPTDHVIDRTHRGYGLKDPLVFENRGVTVCDLAFSEHTYNTLQTFTPITQKQEVREQLSYITNEHTLNALVSESLVIDSNGRDALLALAENISQDASKVYVNPGLVAKIDEVYGKAVEKVESAVEDRTKIAELGYDLTQLSERMHNAENAARVQDGTPKRYQAPEYQGRKVNADIVSKTLSNPHEPVAQDYIEALSHSLDDFEALEEFNPKPSFAGETPEGNFRYKAVGRDSREMMSAGGLGFGRQRKFHWGTAWTKSGNADTLQQDTTFFDEQNKKYGTNLRIEIIKS